MINAPFELAHEDNNPLDLVEDFAHGKGWKFNREDDEFMTITIKGDKIDFEVCLEWQEEFSALLFACTMPIAIGSAQYESAVKTLEQVNQNIWMGHFDLSNKNCYPTFRHTTLLRMIPAGIAVDIVADMIDIAVAECNRFTTTFQLVQAGDVRLHDNLSAAVFETVGEA